MFYNNRIFRRLIMDKNIKELIAESANNIYRKYGIFESFDSLYQEKTKYSERVRDVLYKTLITPERKKCLSGQHSSFWNDIFKANSNIFFCPNFEEAITYLSPYDTLVSFEKLSPEKMNNLCKSELSFKLYTFGILPYFTKEELYNLLKVFVVFLEKNENSLIEKGWPEHYFWSSPWLFYKLAPNYPIQIPAYIKNFSQLINPTDDQYFFFKTDFLNRYNPRIKDYFKPFSLSKYFPQQELSFLEENRPKILELKRRIFKEMLKNLFLDPKDKDECLKNCVKIVFSSFSNEDLNQLLNIEKKYARYKIYGFKINGGLFNLSKFRNQGTITSYYQLLQFCEDYDEFERFKKITYKLEEQLKEIHKKIAINDLFVQEIIHSYKKKFSYSHLLVKPSYFPILEYLYRFLKQSSRIPNSTGLLSGLDMFPKTKKRISPFKLPPNTKWEHIIIRFIDHDTVIVEAPNTLRERVKFYQMGFENKRNNKPDMQWELLYDLAQSHGKIGWTMSTHSKKGPAKVPNPKATSKGKKKISRLRKALIDYFGINDDPFYNYKKYKGYKTKFTLLPEKNSTYYLG